MDDIIYLGATSFVNSKGEKAYRISFASTAPDSFFEGYEAAICYVDVKVFTALHALKVGTHVKGIVVRDPKYKSLKIYRLAE